MILLIFGADALCCCLGCCCSLARGTQTSITIIHELKQQLRERFCTRHVSATFITSIIVYQHYLLIDSCLNLRNINRPQEYSYRSVPHISGSIKTKETNAHPISPLHWEIFPRKRSAYETDHRNGSSFNL